MIVRQVEPDDSPYLLEWRNDPLTRRMSFDASKVSPQVHAQWFEDVLSSRRKHLYIGLENGHRIGVCRFDLNGDATQCEVSINLNPLCRGRGLARNLLIEAMEVFLNEHILPIVARVKKDNVASMRLFESCAYKHVSSDGHEIRYLYTP